MNKGETSDLMQFNYDNNHFDFIMSSFIVCNDCFEQYD